MSLLFGFLFLTALLAAGPAYAQATRTWVSGVGDDVNPCSRTAPCKTFAGAISKTARGGEISVLDPGGYGTITITKSITINGRGSLGGILAAGTTGVIVNITDPADTAKTVILRDLDINGAGTGLDGIRLIAGNKLHVQRVDINGFTDSGIEIAGAASVFIDRSTINDTNRGVNVQPASGIAKVSVTRTSIHARSLGLLAIFSGARVTARDVTVSGALLNTGVYAEFSAKINLESYLVQGNGVGVDSQSSATVRVSNTTVTDNVLGLHFVSGGALLSRSNNTVQDNDTDGTFSGTYGPS